jgi:hypothetical protein
MADRVIDYDRGVIIKTHQTTGIDVFMYVDSPGEYLNAHGNAIAPAFAKQAGYDTDADSKQKLIRDRMKAAKDAIEREVNGVDPTEPQEIIKLDGGYSLLGIGLGRYLLRDPDDNVLTSTPLSKEHAEQVAKVLVNAEAPVETKPAGPASAVKK